MNPLCGKLTSAYSLYNLQEEDSGTAVKRDEANPKYTNYCRDFKGTLDHILYSRQTLEVLELLEMPSDAEITQEEALPSTLFPSDHMRIEAKFLLL